MKTNIKKSESGIAHLGLILAIVLVMAIVGFAIWRVVNNKKPTSSESAVATSTQAEEEEQVDSEIKSGPGEVWNTYYNYKLGFSIQVPKEGMANSGSPCDKIEYFYGSDDKKHPEAGEGVVPHTVIEDGTTFYYTEEYIYEVANEASPTEDCEKVNITLDHLKDYEAYYQSEGYATGDEWYEGPQIDSPVEFSVTPGIKDKSDIQEWVNEQFGEEVIVDGVDLELNENGSKDVLLSCEDSADICLGFRFELQYFEEEEKLFYMGLGHEPHFWGNDRNTSYDDEVIESFKLI